MHNTPTVRRNIFSVHKILGQNKASGGNCDISPHEQTLLVLTLRSVKPQVRLLIIPMETALNLFNRLSFFSNLHGVTSSPNQFVTHCGALLFKSDWFLPSGKLSLRLMLPSITLTVRLKVPYSHK